MSSLHPVNVDNHKFGSNEHRAGELRVNSWEKYFKLVWFSIPRGIFEKLEVCP